MVECCGMFTAFAWLLAIPLTISIQQTTHVFKPWDDPFSGDTKAILEEVGRISATGDWGPIVLLEDHRYVIDKSGRMTSTVRKVYRVPKPDEDEEWSSVEQEYAPWHQSRPELRARVIRPDGTVHWLDPKTIADSPAQEFDTSIYSDRRVVRAPLPAISAGVVVEYEIVIRETAPVFDAGVATRVVVNDYVQTERFHLSVEAAQGVTLRIASQNIPESAIRRRVEGKTTRVECEVGPIAPRKSFEINIPSDESLQPYFSFSTGSSWQAIAARYEEIVNAQIQGADLKPILAGMDLTGNTLDVVSRLTAKLHKEIRYTGVEFGEAAIVPRTPAEVWQRKYGDCKDKAALLVAMLRSANLRAEVALLKAGFDTDADAELPGLGEFNHAIVYVAGENPIWIDATSPETRVGGLPLPDHGRLALIVNRTSSSLVPVPSAPSSANRLVTTIEVHMSEFGRGEFREAIEATGFLEAELRQVYDSRDDKKAREALERYIKQNFQAKLLGQYALTAGDDFSAPFRLNVQAQQARSANTLEDQAVVILHPYLVFERLPYPLTHEDKLGDESQEARKHDFVFHGPHQVEYRYKIHPPRSFRPQALPESKEVQLGLASFSRRFLRNEDGTVEAIFRFDSGKPRLSPAEFEALRKDLREHVRRAPEVISFVSEAAELTALGETGKALQLVRENAARNGGDAAAKVRLARMLVRAGAVESAIALAKKVTETSPDFAPAWQTLAWAYQHDSFGRRFRGNWNRSEAERCYREALKLDPDDLISLIDLAILLEHNASGQRFGKGAQFDEAVSLYRQVLALLPGSELRENLALALLMSRRYAEAREETKKLPEGDVQAVLFLVHTALTESAARAIIESQSQVPDNRVRAIRLIRAAYLLVPLREYVGANDLIKAASRLLNSPLGKQFEVLEKVKRYEDLLVARSDPRYPVQQVLLESLAVSPDMARVRSFLAKEAQGARVEAWLATLRQTASHLGPFAEATEAGEDNLRDLALSLNELKAVGDTDRGYRISHREGTLGSLPAMYVVSENGEYKILGDPRNLGGIGQVVLDLLEERKIAIAQWWLDTVVVDLRPESAYGTGGPAARFLWSGVSDETRGPNAIRATAASMLGRHTASPKSIQILQQARSRVTTELERSQLDLALCESLEMAEQWNALLLVGRRMALTKLFAEDGVRCMLTALIGRKDWPALRAEASKHLKSRNNAYALRAMALSLVNSGDRAGASKYLKDLTDSYFGTGDDHLLEAWNLMALGKADGGTLQRLTDKAAVPGKGDSDYWYTLGTLQARLGRPEEAQRSLVQALEGNEFGTLDAKPWALLSEICEVYGVVDCVQAAERKASSSSQSDTIAQWAVTILSAHR